MATIALITLSDSISDQVTAAKRVMSDLEDSDPTQQATNISNHQANLVLLSSSKVILVREAVAANPLISERLAVQLTLDGSERVLVALAGNSNIGFQAERALTNSFSVSARETLASTTTAISIEQILARDPIASVRVALASKTNIDPIIASLLISLNPDEANDGVFLVLASQRTLNQNSQSFLASSARDHDVRLALAKNTSITECTQFILAETQTVSIQVALLANSAITMNALYVVNNTTAIADPVTPTDTTTMPTMPTVTTTEPRFKGEYTFTEALSVGDFVRYTSTGVAKVTSASHTVFGVVCEAGVANSSGQVLHFGEAEIMAHAEISPTAASIYLIIEEITTDDGSVGQITTVNTGDNDGKVLDVTNIIFPLEAFAAGETGTVFINVPSSRATRGPQGAVGPQGPVGPQGERGNSGRMGVPGLDGRDAVLPDNLQLTDEKGMANGYAGLDATSKIPTAQLPDAALQYASKSDFIAVGAVAAGEPLFRSGAGVKKLDSLSQELFGFAENAAADGETVTVVFQGEISLTVNENIATTDETFFYVMTALTTTTAPQGQTLSSTNAVINTDADSVDRVVKNPRPENYDRVLDLSEIIVPLASITSGASGSFYVNIKGLYDRSVVTLFADAAVRKGFPLKANSTTRIVPPRFTGVLNHVIVGVAEITDAGDNDTIFGFALNSAAEGEPVKVLRYGRLETNISQITIGNSTSLDDTNEFLFMVLTGVNAREITRSYSTGRLLVNNVIFLERSLITGANPYVFVNCFNSQDNVDQIRIARGNISIRNFVTLTGTVGTSNHGVVPVSSSSDEVLGIALNSASAGEEVRIRRKGRVTIPRAFGGGSSSTETGNFYIIFQQVPGILSARPSAISTVNGGEYAMRVIDATDNIRPLHVNAAGQITSAYYYINFY